MLPLAVTSIAQYLSLCLILKMKEFTQVALADGSHLSQNGIHYGRLYASLQSQHLNE
jgi:hypothetical protein